MTHNLTYGQQQEVESHAPYLKIFFALLIFTILEYFYAMLFQQSFVLLVVGLMTLAITKATLVGMYFMHLKFEGRWVYIMLIPAGILAVVLMLGLTPDMAMQPGEPMTVGEDELTSAPVEPGTPALLASRTVSGGS